MGLINTSNDLPHRVRLADSLEDVGPSLRLLGIDLGLCPTPENMKSDGTTKGDAVPVSLAIIEAGATEFSKSSATFVKWAGGVFAVGGTALTFLTGFWTSAGDAVRAATVGGILAVVAALFIALSIIVSSDVRARGVGAAAQYRARADVADSFLRSAVAFATRPAPSDGSEGADANDGTMNSDAMILVSAKDLAEFWAGNQTK